MTTEVNAGKRRCPFCKTEIVIREDKQMWYQEHYYHNQCFLQFSEKFLRIDGQQLINDKATLLNYVSQIFDVDYLNQKFSIDLVGLLRKNFTYQGILYSLVYYIEVKKQKMTAEYGITTVNLIYNEAKKYYQKLYDNKEKINNQVLNSKTQTVYVNIKDNFERKTIDMNNLFKE